MNPTEQDKNTTARPKALRIAALITVIVMIGLILAAVIVSLLNIEGSGKIVIGLLTISFLLGVTIYLIGLFSKLGRKKNDALK